MKTVVSSTLPALIAVSAATLLNAQSTTPSSSDPSASASPHQSEAMRGASQGDGATSTQNAPASFVTKAAQDGMTEVALGKLALSKSNNNDVKQFAQKMVQDHGKANTELAEIAKTKALEVPTQLDAEHQGMVKKLSAKSGSAFDSTYAADMASDHSKAIALFKAAANSGDRDLAGFAKKTLPTLQEHKRMADSLRLSTGQADTAARTR